MAGPYKLNNSTFTLNAGFGLNNKTGDRDKHCEIKYSGAKPKPFGRLAIDKHMETLTVKKMDPVSRQLDVELTNGFRTRYVLDNGVTPVIVVGNKKGFRVVQKDATGVLEFSFSYMLPPVLLAISDSETIPSQIAAEYLKKPLTEITALARGGKLRAEGDRVNLNDVNALKLAIAPPV